MAKKPKQKQTEWNKQGKAIADTAVPYYQNNLTRMENYLQDPSAAIDNYIDKYYTNTAERDTFMRNYNRAMGGATAQNYLATGGGYDTSNQRNYDDYQRYQNDLASKLYDYGVQSGAKLAQQDYNNMLYGNQAYQNAYALGQPYSDTDQYNYMVGQTNKWYNQLGGLLGTAGAVAGGMLGGGVGSTIGASLGNTLGDAFTVQMPSGNNSNIYANMGTNALLGYYNQRDNIPSQTQASIRGETSNNAAAGQFVNPIQQTANYLDNNMANINTRRLDAGFLEAMRRNGVNI